MKHLLLKCLLVAAALSQTIIANAQDAIVKSQNGENNYIPDEKILSSQQRFQDNKFGIFIHWGISSMLGQGEWVMQNQNLNYKEYEKIAGGFYPSGFNAAEWVSAIKASGAKYICLITRHHDSFSLFDTKYSDFNIVKATPFGRDIVKEIANECHKQGIALHLYYSILDWYRDDYMPRGRTGLGTGRPGLGKWESYLDFMCGQLTELLTAYGEVNCIWLDGQWDHDQDADFNWHYDTLYSLIHRLQPGCLIGNNHHVIPAEGENIQIFERDIPGENTSGWHEGGISSLPLETCQTMNDSWGYKIKDLNYKSSGELIRYLVSTSGRNANLLLNIGPQPDGRIPQAALERLAEIGKWMEKYGSTIYGTRSTIVPPQPWGVTTHKGNTLWIHVFPDQLIAQKCSREIFIPYNNAPKIKNATLFDTGEKIKFTQYKEGIFIILPDNIPTEAIDIIVSIDFSNAI